MATRRRIRSTFVQSGGGGGAPPTTGNLAVGPHYGNPLDHTDPDKGEHQVNVTPEMDVVELVNESSVLVAPVMDSVELVNDSSVLVAPAMDTVDLANDSSVLVALTQSAEVVFNDLSVQVAPEMDAVAATYNALSVRSEITGSVLGPPFWQASENATVAGASVTSLAVPIPASAVVGDLLLLFAGCKRTAAQGPDIITGWTSFGQLATPGNTIAVLSYWRVVDGTEGPTVTVPIAGVGGATHIVASCHRINAQHATTPVHVSATATVNTADLDPDPDSPSVTTSGGTPNARVFAVLVHDHAASSQSHTPAAGHVERTDIQVSDGVTFCGMHVQERVFAATGATGAVNHDCTEGVGTDGRMTRVAIAPGTLTIT